MMRSSMAHEPADDIQDAVSELAEIARNAIADTGLTRGELAKKANLSSSSISRLTTGKWVSQGMSQSALLAILQAIDTPTDAVGRAVAIYAQVSKWRRSIPRRLDEPGPASSSRQRIVRYGVAPAQQDGRPYASIDRVTLEQSPEGELTGKIERIEPATQRGATWGIVGRSSPGALHFAFWPLVSDGDKSQASSTGHIAVLRAPSTATPWQGFVTKLEQGKPPSLNSYPFGMMSAQNRRLTDGAGTVAVLDYDNTLARGWIIAPWLEHLAAHDIGATRDGAASLRQLFAEHKVQATRDHDLLATRAAAIYAQALKGVSVAALERLAEDFIDEYLEDDYLYASSRDLVAGLRDRGLRPVLVTGAPAELIRPLLTALDFERAFSLVLREEAGVYTGEVVLNRGVSRAKAAACQTLTNAQDAEIVVAFGDSESDRALWNAAGVSVRIGGDRDATDVTISGVDLDQPVDPRIWERVHVAEWRRIVASDAQTPTADDLSETRLG
jgi:phosphoserine phosphatase/transcriptional regulator with XRE-family HTH domain